jgi:osmoprotectant transport system permease protein
MLLQQIFSYIADPQNEFVMRTLTTLEYTFIPLVLCVLIAVPLGVLVAPNPVAAFLAANLSGTARAIPTIAFLAVAIPILGIGFRPTIVALTLLGIPPILLNTVAGLRAIDPAALEAGRGMGMTRWQVLARVQIPLVLPVVAAGVRTSGVQIAATTPLAGLIGGGGYGDYISFALAYPLLTTSALVPLLIGATAVAALALLTEVSLGAVQRAVTPAGLRGREPVEAPATRGAGPAESGGNLAAA